MNVLMAFTRKRRNLIRIQRAYLTVAKQAVKDRDRIAFKRAHFRREALIAAVGRRFQADCEAAK